MEAAIALIDEQGVGAASMRNIAVRLQVKAMSLYRYFETRDALLDAVVARIVSQLDDDVDLDDDPGWRVRLDRLARGVRRYALAHPHAFPLVTTRPAEAPWVNPPLRSLPWIETLLAGLEDDGFSDEQILFTYRSFNSFLLGFLLLETGAMSLDDPQPGDGSYAGDTEGDTAGDPQPVPGGLTPTRTEAETDAIADSDRPVDLIDPQSSIDLSAFPTIQRLAAGLAEEHFDDEFSRALDDLLDRVERHLEAATPRA